MSEPALTHGLRPRGLKLSGIPTPERICEAYGGDPYVGYQAPRYSTLLALLARHVTRDTRILDVGRTMLTEMIESLFERPVDSVGFEPDAVEPTGAQHRHFDLNDAQWPEKWLRDLPGYDLIILAEVIEHLYTSPSLVLGFLQSLLRPGGLLIVQTPNALAIGRRFKMLLGRHPFELIRENPYNPGHFREYTARELEKYGRQLGLVIVHSEHHHSIDLRHKFALMSRKTEGREAAGKRTLLYRLHELGITNFVYRHLPPTLRPGLTVIFQKPSAASPAEIPGQLDSNLRGQPTADLSSGH